MAMKSDQVCLPTLLLLVGAALAVVLAAAPGGAPPILTSLAAQQPETGEPSPLEAGRAAAEAQCSTCHRVPPPQALPRRVWRTQIETMWLIVQGKTDRRSPAAEKQGVTLPPEWQPIASYYEATAPDHLPATPPWPSTDGGLKFRTRTIAPAIPEPAPAISNLQLVDLNGDGRLDIVAGDMRHGVIVTASPHDPRAVLRELAQVPHPAHIQPVDFDGDGVLDFLVGDLGAFMPTDHDRGAIVWLRGGKDGTYNRLSLRGWPPVTDVRAADFDGDGRLDLAVAAFGWRRTGEFTILKNNTTDYSEPSFVPFTIEQRTGAIHAVVADIDRDRRADVVVLFAQEHEMVVAFLNRGGMQFERQLIYQAPHPVWGSSGIQVVDLDGDGDLDVLMTNGDSFDDAIKKPYHGITWLENRGTYPFTEHTLAKLGGVHRAQAADMDGDGDLDIVACALGWQHDEDAKKAPKLVWLEQTSRGVFEPHVLAVGPPTHATLDLGDFDGDGDIDIVVGNFSAGQPQEGWVDVWENLRKN
jgi:mono/diheme cytochrome c family protein